MQDCHEAIVDRETYDKVRLELEKRRIDAKRGKKEKGKYHTKYCLSRLLFCPYCGGAYKRTTWTMQKIEKMGRVALQKPSRKMKCKISSIMKMSCKTIF